MRKLLRTTIGLAAASALLFVWSPPSGADGNIYIAPVHHDATAVCAVTGDVSFTDTHGVNLHPTKNIYNFDSANIDCEDLDENDATTIGGVFEVNAMGDTTGITHTAATPSTTGETCEEGHHTTEGTGIVIDREAPHLGDVGTIHIFFQRFGGHVTAWGTVMLPTVGHKTFRATLTFTPSHAEEVIACVPGAPGSSETTAADHGTGPMVKITTADLVGEAEIYATESETYPSSSVPATITQS
jgi:hypothetical protein